jgi:hypothetical protein
VSLDRSIYRVQGFLAGVLFGIAATLLAGALFGCAGLQGQLQLSEHDGDLDIAGFNEGGGGDAGNWSGGGDIDGRTLTAGVVIPLGESQDARALEAIRTLLAGLNAGVGQLVAGQLELRQALLEVHEEPPEAEVPEPEPVASEGSLRDLAGDYGGAFTGAIVLVLVLVKAYRTIFPKADESG